MTASIELAVINPHPRLVATDPRILEMFGRRDERQDLLGEQIDALNDRIANLETTIAQLERLHLKAAGVDEKITCVDCKGTGVARTVEHPTPNRIGVSWSKCETCRGKGFVWAVPFFTIEDDPR